RDDDHLDPGPSTRAGRNRDELVPLNRSATVSLSATRQVAPTEPRQVHVDEDWSSQTGTGHRVERFGATACGAQRAGRMAPVSTRSPDDAGLPPARCRVTVRLGYSGGGTPAHSVTFRASLNVPIGTSTPAAFLSQAS